MISQELSKAAQPTESADSSSKPLFHCGSGPADSSTTMYLKCGYCSWNYRDDSSGCVRPECLGELFPNLESNFESI